MDTIVAAYAVDLKGGMTVRLQVTPHIHSFLLRPLQQGNQRPNNGIVRELAFMADLQYLIQGSTCCP